ncbi:MAG: hypothetical protein OQK24_04735 [Magnetovibrio sp.]|nr:hypothetical protein [Magnetovibrio sp.]
MRWSVFVVLQGLILSALFGVYYIHQDRVIVLKKPPASIAQWYKPQNKRQVWLHTMFNLRREMLAVGMYASAQDDKNLQDWAGKLSQHYQKIGEMVPEWQGRLSPNVLADIKSAAQEKRYSDVALGLEKLEQNCKSCHVDFRAVTATMYRAPNFSNLSVEGAPSLNAHMRTMSTSVNKLKLAFVGGRDDDALSAFVDLKRDMNSFGAVCGNCHKQGKPYPSPVITEALSVMEQSLKTGDLKDKGRALGTLAVLACAECHGTHRISYDIRQLFTEQKSWAELLKHK